MASEVRFTLQIDGPDGHREFALLSGIMTMGRQPGNELVLDSPQVSRKHAQIEVSGREVKITDLGSANGTRVDGEIIGQQLSFSLSKGSIIRIGPFELVLEITEEAPLLIASDREIEPLTPLPPDQELNKPIRSIKKETDLSDLPKGSPRKTPLGGEGGSPPARREIKPAESKNPLSSGFFPIGLRSQKLIHYLPGIYHTDFMEQFLGLFESILLPVEWTIDNFDIFLDVDSSPYGFITWLASWYGIIFDSTWSENQRRIFLREAAQLYNRRGTRWSMVRMLEIYTGMKPEISDQGSSIKPFHFEVVFKKGIGTAQKVLVEQLIDKNKPAQSFYLLKIE